MPSLTSQNYRICFNRLIDHDAEKVSDYVKCLRKHDIHKFAAKPSGSVNVLRTKNWKHFRLDFFVKVVNLRFVLRYGDLMTFVLTAIKLQAVSLLCL